MLLAAPSLSAKIVTTVQAQANLRASLEVFKKNRNKDTAAKALADYEYLSKQPSAGVILTEKGVTQAELRAAAAAAAALAAPAAIAKTIEDDLKELEAKTSNATQKNNLIRARRKWDASKKTNADVETALAETGEVEYALEQMKTPQSIEAQIVPAPQPFNAVKQQAINELKEVAKDDPALKSTIDDAMVQVNDAQTQADLEQAENAIENLKAVAEESKKIDADVEEITKENNTDAIAAATKIQANFRGFKARKDLFKKTLAETQSEIQQADAALEKVKKEAQTKALTVESELQNLIADAHLSDEEAIQLANGAISGYKHKILSYELAKKQIEKAKAAQIKADKEKVANAPQPIPAAPPLPHVVNQAQYDELLDLINKAGFNQPTEKLAKDQLEQFKLGKVSYDDLKNSIETNKQKIETAKQDEETKKNKAAEKAQQAPSAPPANMPPAPPLPASQADIQELQNLVNTSGINDKELDDIIIAATSKKLSKVDAEKQINALIKQAQLNELSQLIVANKNNSALVEMGQAKNEFDQGKKDFKTAKQKIEDYINGAKTQKDACESSTKSLIDECKAYIKSASDLIKEIDSTYPYTSLVGNIDFNKLQASYNKLDAKIAEYSSLKTKGEQLNSNGCYDKLESNMGQEFQKQIDAAHTSRESLKTKKTKAEADLKNKPAPSAPTPQSVASTALPTPSFPLITKGTQVTPSVSTPASGGGQQSAAAHAVPSGTFDYTSKNANELEAIYSQLTKQRSAVKKDAGKLADFKTSNKNQIMALLQAYDNMSGKMDDAERLSNIAYIKNFMI